MVSRSPLMRNMALSLLPNARLTILLIDDDGNIYA